MYTMSCMSPDSCTAPVVAQHNQRVELQGNSLSGSNYKFWNRHLPERPPIHTRSWQECSADVVECDHSILTGPVLGLAYNVQRSAVRRLNPEQLFPTSMCFSHLLCHWAWSSFDCNWVDSTRRLDNQTFEWHDWFCQVPVLHLLPFRREPRSIGRSVCAIVIGMFQCNQCRWGAPFASVGCPDLSLDHA